MNKIKINNYKEIEKYMNILKLENISIDLSECNQKDYMKIIYTLSGIAIYHKGLKKIKNREFMLVD